MTGDTLIQLALGLPALGAVGIALTGFNRDLREGVTLVTGLALFWVVVLNLLPMVLAGERPEWVALTAFGTIDLAFSVEPLGMLFASIASTLWIVNSIYSIGYMRGNDEPRQTLFYVCFAIAISSAMGIAFAGNLFTLFLFYEVLTVSTYPLVAHKRNAEAQSKARVYILLLMGTSIGFLLPAVIWTYAAAGTPDFVAGGILSGAGLSDGALMLLFALFIFGIGKAAVMPVHFWLPAAMVAPTPVSALLHAVAVVKAGVFSVVKITVYIFGLDLLTETGASEPIAYIAGGTVVLASVIALGQDNLKRRLAFSTISQLSYVVMAAAIATPLAIIGAAMHILAHAVSKITLFFAAGSIYTAHHLTDVSQLDGLGRRMPLTFVAFLIGAVSIIGLPPLIGVWSKWWIGIGAAETGDYWAIAVLMISSLLNVAYLLPIVSRAFFLPLPGQDPDAPVTRAEAPLPILIALTITSLLCFALFLIPNEIQTLLAPIVQTLPVEVPNGQ